MRGVKVVKTRYLSESARGISLGAKSYGEN